MIEGGRVVGGRLLPASGRDFDALSFRRKIERSLFFLLEKGVQALWAV
jgi:hypothetical protein